MTRQEMLDAINMKIARKIDNPAPLPPKVRNELQYFPVMIGDVLDFGEHRKVNWICPKCKLKTIQETLRWDSEEDVYRCMKHTPSLACYRDYSVESLLVYWETKRKPLHDQDDDCVSYVYSLIQENKIIKSVEESRKKPIGNFINI